MDIKKLRSRLGFTQVQMGRAMGVDGNTIARWERGTLGMSGTATRLAEVFEWLAGKGFRRPILENGGEAVFVVRAYPDDNFVDAKVDDPRGETIGEFESMETARNHVEGGNSRTELRRNNHVVFFKDGAPEDWRVWAACVGDPRPLWLPATPAMLKELQDKWKGNLTD